MRIADLPRPSRYVSALALAAVVGAVVGAGATRWAPRVGPVRTPRSPARSASPGAPVGLRVVAAVWDRHGLAVQLAIENRTDEPLRLLDESFARRLTVGGPAGETD